MRAPCNFYDRARKKSGYKVQLLQVLRHSTATAKLCHNVALLLYSSRYKYYRTMVLSVDRPASTGHCPPSFRPLSTGSINPIQSHTTIFNFTQHDDTV